MARNAKQVKSAGNNLPDLVAPELEPDNYPARLVGMVFEGVQKQRPFKGEAKPPVDMVRLTYELSHEFMQDESGNVLEDKPRWFSEVIPFHSLEVDLAKSTKRYQALDPKDTCDGDFSGLLTRPCSITVSVDKPNTGKHAGKVFTNIVAVSPAPKMPGYVQPELVNPTTYFDPQDEDCDIEVFRGLPEFLQEIIRNADDYAGSPLAEKLGGDAEAPKEAPDAPEDEDHNSEY